MTPDEIVRDLSTKGHAIVPGLLDPQSVDRIREAALEAYKSIGGSAWPNTAPNTLHFSDLATLRPALANGVIQRFTQTVAFEVYRKLFAPEISFPLLLSIFRYQKVGIPSFTPWHQDYEPDTSAQSYIGDTQLMNTWIALDDCGVCAPGIELVAEPITEFMPEYRAYDFIEADDPKTADTNAQIEKRFPLIARPVLQAGDAVMFDQFAVHRTSFSLGMTKGRMSVEIRACNGRLCAEPGKQLETVTA